jgi:hypothetical protein
VCVEVSINSTVTVHSPEAFSLIDMYIFTFTCKW